MSPELTENWPNTTNGRPSRHFRSGCVAPVSIPGRVTIRAASPAIGALGRPRLDPPPRRAGPGTRWMYISRASGPILSRKFGVDRAGRAKPPGRRGAAGRRSLRCAGAGLVRGWWHCNRARNKETGRRPCPCAGRSGWGGSPFDARWGLRVGRPLRPGPARRRSFSWPGA
jgi:hypothetical protein